jgi:hypothetical protein
MPVGEETTRDSGNSDIYAPLISKSVILLAMIGGTFLAHPPLVFLWFMQGFCIVVLVETWYSSLRTLQKRRRSGGRPRLAIAHRDSGPGPMICDQFHSARIAARPAGAVLYEGGIWRLLVPALLALIPLVAAGLIAAALPSLNFHAIVTAPWLQRILGLLMLAILAAFIALPLWGAAELLGQRYEFVFDRSQRHLLARSRWFGFALRSRSHRLDQFQRVCVRLEEFPGGAFGASWWFTVSCEGEGVLLRLVGCDEHARAVELAAAIAAQLKLPVEDQCYEES